MCVVAKKLVEIPHVKTTHETLRRRDRQIERIADAHDGETGFQLGGVAQRKTGTALIGDLQKGDAAAWIVADDAGRHLDAVDLGRARWCCRR